MDLSVNKNEWDSLSEEERKRISAIMSGYFKGTNIVPDGSAALAPQEDVYCEIACSAAEAAAVAACGGNPVCIVIAHAAGDACRRSC